MIKKRKEKWDDRERERGRRIKKGEDMKREKKNKKEEEEEEEEGYRGTHYRKEKNNTLKGTLINFMTRSIPIL